MSQELRPGRPVPINEHAMLREALEAHIGRLKDYEVPSKNLIASKMDDMETNMPRVADLRDVSSTEDGEVDLLQGNLDVATGTFKMKAARNTVWMPKAPEELRLRHRRLGIAGEMARTKHLNRVWLQGHLIEAFRQLSDHILGRHVSGLALPQEQKPKWAIVLNYEQEIRKKAYQWVRKGDIATLEEGILRGIKDAEVMNLQFVVPVTTTVATSSIGGGARQTQRPASPAAGKAAGKGKGRGGGIRPTKKLFVKTPTTASAPQRAATSCISVSGAWEVTPSHHADQAATTQAKRPRRMQAPATERR